jgi:hypothetical protein
MFNFDKAGRYLIRLDPVGFFIWLGAAFVGAWQFRGWLDTSAIPFPGDRQRVCDTVAEFIHRTDRRRRCLLDTEVQSRPHPDMPERLGEYAFQLRRERRYGRGRHGKYQVIGAVLNLTGAVQPNVLDMTEATLNGQGLRIGVVQRTLREEVASTTLQRIAAGELARCILPWIPLMQGGGDPAIIAEWRRLALLEPKENWRGDFGALALTFAELAKRKGVWQTGLEGWNVRESKFLADWTKQAVKEAKKDAVLKEKQNALVCALQIRLQNPLSPDLVNTISECNDPDELDRWFQESLTANTLAEFRANAEV